MTCPLIGTGVDADNRGRTPAPGCQRQSVGERKGARAMSIKEKIRVHIEIERANKAKLDAWRESMRKAGAAK